MINNKLKQSYLESSPQAKSCLASSSVFLPTDQQDLLSSRLCTSSNTLSFTPKECKDTPLQSTSLSQSLRYLLTRQQSSSFSPPKNNSPFSFHQLSTPLSTPLFFIQKKSHLNHHHGEVVVCSCHTSHAALSTHGEVVPHFYKKCLAHSPTAKEGSTVCHNENFLND